MKLAIVSRDGVINQAIAGGVNHRTQLQWLPGSVEALAQLSQAGFTVVIITHQPGISRGLLDLDELEAIHSAILNAVEIAGGEVAGVFYCPHDVADNCYCQPSQTGILDVIAMEFDADLETACYFFGGDNNDYHYDYGRRFQCGPQQPLALHVQTLLQPN